MAEVTYTCYGSAQWLTREEMKTHQRAAMPKWRVQRGSQHSEPQVYFVWVSENECLALELPDTTTIQQVIESVLRLIHDRRKCLLIDRGEHETLLKEVCADAKARPRLLHLLWVANQLEATHGLPPARTYFLPHCLPMCMICLI